MNDSQIFIYLLAMGFGCGVVGYCFGRAHQSEKNIQDMKKLQEMYQKFYDDLMLKFTETGKFTKS